MHDVRLWLTCFAALKNAVPLYGQCSFAEHLQGTYKVQLEDAKQPVAIADLENSIQYQQFHVGPKFISPWGECVEKFGHSYVLRQDKIGNFICHQCVTLFQRTPNVLQVLADPGYCSPNVELAKSNCGQMSIDKPGSGIIFWKSEDVQYVKCPIQSKATVKYKVDGQVRCDKYSTDPTTMDNCQYGHQLSVKFKNCDFAPHEVDLQCLGTWPSVKNNRENFLAVYNAKLNLYKCGILERSTKRDNVVRLAFSTDSNCEQMLSNSTSGYELFEIHPKRQKIMWPKNMSAVMFPPQIRGVWNFMTITERLVTYYRNNDPTTKAVAYGKCVEVDGDKMMIYSKSKCNDNLGYQCVQISRRSESLVEIKFNHQQYEKFSRGLCVDDRQYVNIEWKTMESNKPENYTTCSFYGEYTSDWQTNQRTLCYTIETNCRQPYEFVQRTHYCQTKETQNVIYYNCIASWREGDYNFDYVQQKSTNRAGCFVSRRSRQTIELVWTGRDCQRYVDFDRLQEDLDEKLMSLNMKHLCTSNKTISPVSNPWNEWTTPMAGDQSKSCAYKASTILTLFVELFFLWQMTQLQEVNWVIREMIKQ